jgi:hypothetical protein
MKPFNIDDKKVFAGLMGELGANEATKLTPAWKHFEKNYLDELDPITKFNEILKGLSDEQKIKVGIKIDCKIGNQITNYLWIESHKPEILRAVLEVMEGE